MPLDIRTGSYNLTYMAKDKSGLTAVGYVLLIVEYRTQSTIWIATEQSCAQGPLALQAKVGD